MEVPFLQTMVLSYRIILFCRLRKVNGLSAVDDRKAAGLFYEAMSAFLNGTQ